MLDQKCFSELESSHFILRSLFQSDNFQFTHVPLQEDSQARQCLQDVDNLSESSKTTALVSNRRPVGGLKSPLAQSDVTMTMTPADVDNHVEEWQKNQLRRLGERISLSQVLIKNLPCNKTLTHGITTHTLTQSYLSKRWVT